MKRIKALTTIQIVLFILTLTLISNAEETIPVGRIEGAVLDSDTKMELTGANVLIIGTTFGASTDAYGKYRITSIPAGSYSVQCTYLGYTTRIIPNIIVKPGRAIQVNIELTETAIETGGVTVTPSYFAATETEPVSAVQMSYEEIRRAPGSAGDVSRIIMSLPSVAKVNDTRNNLVVRGGSPLENGYYVDGMPVPNINHFPSQGASGGAMGLLNVDFINDVKFHAGGFPADYGDRLSSITDIRLREGNPTELEGQLDLSMIGAGGLLEGPLKNDKGSWFIGARRSYFDLVANAFSVEASTIPYSADLQGKIDCNLSNTHRLTFLEVAGIDNSIIKKDDAIDNKENFYGQADWLQNTTGLNWRWLWGKHGYSNTSLTYNYMDWDSEWKEALTTDLLTNNKSIEQYVTLRSSNHIVTAPGCALDVGVENKLIDAALDYTIAANTDPFGNPTPEIIRDESIQSMKAGVFASYRHRLSSRLTITPGIRADYFEYNGHSNISPRFAFSWMLTSKTSLSGAYGRYYQFLPLVLLTQSESFKNLDEPSADHAVLGISHLLNETTRMTVEIYDKEYNNLPLDSDQPLLSIIDETNDQDGFSAHDKLVSTGKARTYGIELMLQKKLAEDFYGLVSGSFFRSRYRDYHGTWRDRDYDNRFMAILEGGYKPNLSWDFSMKWVYAGGAPYTPFDEAASQIANSEILNEARINESRLPDYHSLNIRVDRRFHYRSSSLIVYLSIWNVYARDNIASYYWNEIDNKSDSYKQWGTIPAIGLEYEF